MDDDKFEIVGTPLPEDSVSAQQGELSAIEVLATAVLQERATLAEEVREKEVALAAAVAANDQLEMEHSQQRMMSAETKGRISMLRDEDISYQDLRAAASSRSASLDARRAKPALLSSILFGTDGHRRSRASAHSESASSQCSCEGDPGSSSDQLIDPSDEQNEADGRFDMISYREKSVLQYLIKTPNSSQQPALKDRSCETRVSEPCAIIDACRSSDGILQHCAADPSRLASRKVLSRREHYAQQLRNFYISLDGARVKVAQAGSEGQASLKQPVMCSLCAGLRGRKALMPHQLQMGTDFDASPFVASQLAQLDQILDMFHGREEDLFILLKGKYGFKDYPFVHYLPL